MKRFDIAFQLLMPKLPLLMLGTAAIVIAALVAFYANPTAAVFSGLLVFGSGVLMAIPASFVSIRASKQLRLVPNFNRDMSLLCAAIVLGAGLTFALFLNISGKSSVGLIELTTYIYALVLPTALVAPLMIKNTWGLAAYYVLATGALPLVAATAASGKAPFFSIEVATIIVSCCIAIYLYRLSQFVGTKMPNIKAGFVESLGPMTQKPRPRIPTIFDYSRQHHFTKKDRFWGLLVDSGPESRLLLIVGVSTPILIMLIHTAIVVYGDVGERETLRMIAISLAATSFAPFFGFWGSTIVTLASRARLLWLRVGGSVNDFWAINNRYLLDRLKRWIPCSMIGWATVAVTGLPYDSAERLVILPLCYLMLFSSFAYTTLWMTHVGNRLWWVVASLIAVCLVITMITVTISSTAWNMIPLHGAPLVTLLTGLLALSWYMAKQSYTRNPTFA